MQSIIMTVHRRKDLDRACWWELGPLLKYVKKKTAVVPFIIEQNTLQHPICSISHIFLG